MNGQVVVVGGGIAGCSAAIEAARGGLSVTLIDEHPQSPAAMSLDTPYFYGSRLDPVLSDASAIADRVLGANDALLECLETGVEVLTSVCVWANYVPGPNSTHAQESRLGLADAERSWLLPYDHLIIAAGARDLVLSFPGWQLPGVLGVGAAFALLNRYNALGGTKIVILGSGNAALLLATQCLENGIEVAAVVDVSETTRGDLHLYEALKARNVPFYFSTVISATHGSTAVEKVSLKRVDRALQIVDSAETSIACDTVCMAYGLLPNIELAAQSGCALDYDAARSGWVPRTNESHQTALANIYVVGDAAGLTEAMIIDPAIASKQGQRAAVAIIDGAAAAVPTPPSKAPPAPVASVSAEWLKALRSASGDDVIVCQCEDVTRADLLAVREPRYLTGQRGRLSASARNSQDLVKRLTRAGMGHCQGKRCRDHVALLLAEMNREEVAQVIPGSYRAPLRPLPLAVLADQEESEESRRLWPTWFQPLNEGEIG